MNGASNVNAASSSSSSSSDLPDVQVFLSRPTYPLGGSIVGTIVIRQSSSSSSSPQQEPLRSVLTSAVVYVAGFCRIDPRWHNVAEYTKIYGKIHPFMQLLYQEFDPELLLEQQGGGGGGGGGGNQNNNNGEETVCFWATNGLELLELSERKEGKWDHLDDDDEVLAFTFRVDIPLDVPHSMNAATCRYSYSADLLIKTSQNKQRVIKNPFSICTNPQQPLGLPRSQQNQTNMIISGRVKFGTCSGMAHSIGLPCHLSATEIHRPQGQMTVAIPRWSSSTRGGGGEDIQTMRVSNALGQNVCVMTIVGATKMTPGSRIHLQWDFPGRISQGWIPCHQVSACLMGEEVAVYEDKTTTRAQSFVFDTCHEWVDPGVTHRVSKTLLLSMDAPCNLYTDVMELSIRCQVDITVKEEGEYNNLRIELPCQVVHNNFVKEEDAYEQEENQVSSLSELLGLKDDPTEESYFPTNDIVSDLKQLSLKMEASFRQTIQQS
jgi:hypothetical protein